MKKKDELVVVEWMMRVMTLLHAFVVVVFRDVPVLPILVEVDAMVAVDVVAHVDIYRHTTLVAPAEQEARLAACWPRRQFVMPPRLLQLQRMHTLQHDHAFELHNIVPWPQQDVVAGPASTAIVVQVERRACCEWCLRTRLISPHLLAVEPRFLKEGLPWLFNYLEEVCGVKKGKHQQQDKR